MKPKKWIKRRSETSKLKGYKNLKVKVQIKLLTCPLCEGKGWLEITNYIQKFNTWVERFLFTGDEELMFHYMALIIYWEGELND